MQDLRKHLIARRAGLSSSEVDANSRIIAKKIQLLEVFRQARHVAFYHAMEGEVCLDALWKGAASQGKQCYFPICCKQRMHFVPVTPKTPWSKQSLGFMEPEVELSLAVPVTDLDVAIFPLVAFDAFGVRVGMGKGYYDRAFACDKKSADKQPTRIGVAHEFQHQKYLEKQPWDVLLHATVTEKQVYWTNRF